MRLDIEQEVSSIADSVAGASDIITNKRSIKTNVMVDDGQVVVLGGLIEETINESVQKVPLLGDVPYLGALFRSKTSDVRKTNLMVFIHPVILRDASTMNNYTNAKYNDIRVIQMEQNNDGVNMMPGKQQPVLPNINDYTIMPGPGTLPAPPEMQEVPVSTSDTDPVLE
jgi:general secretion pathway protein D